jgi:hypothetical protein
MPAGQGLRRTVGVAEVFKKGCSGLRHQPAPLQTSTTSARANPARVLPLASCSKSVLGVAAAGGAMPELWIGAGGPNTETVCDPRFLIRRTASDDRAAHAFAAAGHAVSVARRGRNFRLHARAHCAVLPNGRR